jgi:ketosteroid isomerase-like protein
MATQLNVATLKRAIEGNDAETLIGLYDDDAVLRVVDSIHPPSHPLELHGKSEIGAFFRDVCGRSMTHHIDQSLESDGHLAFTEECQYPSGTNVLCSAMVDISEGRIMRELMVQAWDDQDLPRA